MINTKEVQPILASIYCLNRVGARDMLIDRICDYAFRRLFGANTNLLAFACLCQSKEETEQLIIKMLEADTKFRNNLEEN